jgi:hypothetical protein
MAYVTEDTMTQDLIAQLKQTYGIISQQTETSGLVAVRNVTALQQLRAMCDEHRRRLMLSSVTAEPITKGFPVLVRITETR